MPGGQKGTHAGKLKFELGRFERSKRRSPFCGRTRIGFLGAGVDMVQKKKDIERILNKRQRECQGFEWESTRLPFFGLNDFLTLLKVSQGC
mmetsp:Transcript_9892/g.14358  ORF Transcript_9892/g.14358 Transcript_9892/m.14358 type:complete len:91 (+) Transcript_9892:106-378(+)